MVCHQAPLVLPGCHGVRRTARRRGTSSPSFSRGDPCRRNVCLLATARFEVIARAVAGDRSARHILKAKGTGVGSKPPACSLAISCGHAACPYRGGSIDTVAYRNSPLCTVAPLVSCSGHVGIRGPAMGCFHRQNVKKLDAGSGGGGRSDYKFHNVGPL